MEGQPPIEIVNRISDPTFPADYVQAIEEGITEAASSGELGGYPVIDWKVTINSAEYREGESSEVAFENAARMAFGAASKAAGPVLLEPIMNVEVVTEESYFGQVVGDLNSRRAEINETLMRGHDRVIHAVVPLREMFGYVTKLRSLTSGRATSTMTPARYAPVPAAEARQLVGY